MPAASISAVEDALLAKCRAVLGQRVRTVESLPAEWDDDMLRRLLRAIPGCYVAFAGGQRTRSSGVVLGLDTRWVVYVATGHASGEAARRRGDSLQAGAYELVQALLPQLDGLDVADAGMAEVRDVANLYTGQVDKQGLAVYAVTLALPMSFELPEGGDELVPFETFTAQFDLAPFEDAAEHRAWLDGTPTDTAPQAQDQVDLPQG